MIRHLLLAATALVAATAAHANAVSITTTEPSNFGLVDLDPFIGESNFTVAGYGAFSGDAIVYAAGDQVPGVRSAPGATTGFIATQPTTSETLSFATPKDAFNLELYTPDLYNGISFSNGVSYSGAQLQALTGFSFDGAGVSFLSFTGMPGFTSVTFTTTGVAEEFNPGAAAAPEASTWAMLGLGFASMGLVAYRRKRSPRYAIA